MNIELKKGNCLKLFKQVNSQSVDLVLTDLPYGITQNKWDCIIPVKNLWYEFERIIKPNGLVILTAAEPFSSYLIYSSIENCKKVKFKYDIIWEKTISSGQLNVKRQPLRNHEQILVFYNKQPIYNPQMQVGEPYSINRKTSKYKSNYGLQKDHTSINSGTRYPKSVIKISNPRVKGGHPTQKPIELMEWLIKTYTNENDIVLDCCMGSGTTGVACKNTNRNFIGFEKDKKWFSYAKERIENY